MALGPIPFSQIDRRAEHMPQGEAELFRACISAMDRAYLDHFRRNGEPEASEGDEGLRNQFDAAMGVVK